MTNDERNPIAEARSRYRAASIRVSGFVLLSTFILGHPSLISADWPQWRGPDRNGLIERGPALIASLTGQTPTWQSQPIPSGDRGGRGSPVVSAGRVYGLTSTATASPGPDEVFCLDAANGRLLWKSRLGDKAVAETASSTPCIANGRLYIAGSGTTVFCLDADTGKQVWNAVLSRTEGKPIASSIAVIGKVTVLIADVLTGVDADTGKVLWTQDRITGLESSPALWQTAESKQVICNTAPETYAVDATNGHILWSIPGGGKSTPVIVQEYGGDFVVNLSENRRTGLSAYRLTPKGPEKLWTLPFTDRASSPVVFDGHVYAIAGGSNGHGAHLVCVHLDTGKVA